MSERALINLIIWLKCLGLACFATGFGLQFADGFDSAFRILGMLATSDTWTLIIAVLSLGGPLLFLTAKWAEHAFGRLSAIRAILWTALTAIAFSLWIA